MQQNMESTINILERESDPTTFHQVIEKLEETKK